VTEAEYLNLPERTRLEMEAGREALKRYQLPVTVEEPTVVIEVEAPAKPKRGRKPRVTETGNSDSEMIEPDTIDQEIENLLSETGQLSLLDAIINAEMNDTN
jgi:hypothetical protein